MKVFLEIFVSLYLWSVSILLQVSLFCLLYSKKLPKQNILNFTMTVFVKILGVPKTNLCIVTILQDFSQLHAIFFYYTLISTKETLFSMKYNVYCLRKYMYTCTLHTKSFDCNVTPYLHLAILHATIFLFSR